MIVSKCVMIVIIIFEMKCVQYLKLIKQIFIQRIRIRIPRNFAQDNDFLNGGKKIWIKRCLIPWSYKCHQEIQKYIRIIYKNVVDIIMQNHGQTVFREVCDDCYYNIRNVVCPIFETYHTTFIQRIKITIPRSIKQDTKSLNRGGIFWIKMCLRSQS